MTQFSAGLVSITFRRLSPEEIVDLVAQAGLTDIEWGGDIHVPHGDRAAAKRVRSMTEQAGLRTAAYGSYYRVGGEPDAMPFKRILDTAAALGAPLIRVWAGNVDSAIASAEYIDQVAQDACRIGELAAQAGIKVAFEYHGGTVADNAQASLALLVKAAHPNLYSLWQPSVGLAPSERAESLAKIMPRLAHLHVFHWSLTERLPLGDGASEWRAYIDILKTRSEPTPLLIEFVKGDAPEMFLQDAQALKVWVGN
jgi:sugar phosphate isomerase/epimerase